MTFSEEIESIDRDIAAALRRHSGVPWIVVRALLDAQISLRIAKQRHEEQEKKP